jgi:hypothetical protein
MFLVILRKDIFYLQSAFHLGVVRGGLWLMVGIWTSLKRPHRSIHYATDRGQFD